MTDRNPETPNKCAHVLLGRNEELMVSRMGKARKTKASKFKGSGNVDRAYIAACRVLGLPLSPVNDPSRQTHERDGRALGLPDGRRALLVTAHGRHGTAKLKVPRVYLTKRTCALVLLVYTKPGKATIVGWTQLEAPPEGDKDAVWRPDELEPIESLIAAYRPRPVKVKARCRFCLAPISRPSDLPETEPLVACEKTECREREHQLDAALRA
jgi:hypothetical protein